MTFEIDTDVPMPDDARHYNGGAPAKYPFRDMEVGNSFFSPDVPGSAPARQRVSGAATLMGKKLGRKFATRIVTENGVKGVRCWRIA